METLTKTYEKVAEIAKSKDKKRTIDALNDLLQLAIETRDLKLLMDSLKLIGDIYSDFNDLDNMVFAYN